jgi:NADH-quinone oxidoreductase subunit N
VQAADARGVSASLYYLFAYMFMVIGTFAVITVIGRVGDTGHQLSDYRGLGRRQPVLAGAFAVFLLAQAGIPFTTGFLAKFQVVAASVDVHSYALAVVAMVSAAVAAFFYLRVGITMYSPVGLVADPVPGGVDPASAVATGGEGEPRAPVDPDGAPDGTRWGLGVHEPGQAERASLALMTEAPVAADVADRVVDVPPLTWVAIALCAAFTVVFGIIPEPIIDFAHQATLLFVS